MFERKKKWRRGAAAASSVIKIIKIIELPSRFLSDSDENASVYNTRATSYTYIQCTHRNLHRFIKNDKRVRTAFLIGNLARTDFRMLPSIYNIIIYYNMPNTHSIVFIVIYNLIFFFLFRANNILQKQIDLMNFWVSYLNQIIENLNVSTQTFIILYSQSF